MKARTSDEHDFISYDKHEHIAGESNVGSEEQGQKVTGASCNKGNT